MVYLMEPQILQRPRTHPPLNNTLSPSRHQTATYTQKRPRALTSSCAMLTLMLLLLPGLNWATVATESTPAEQTELKPQFLSPPSLEQPELDNDVDSTGGNYSIANFEQAIAQLEEDQGPYNPQLIQQLQGLGLSYQSQGQHQQAVDIFKRAIHISRVNEGLYSFNQVPMLERLIESHVARGNWKQANDRHHYMYWLYQRNYGEADPRMLPAINKLSNWHLNAYNLKVGTGLHHHLINAHTLYSMAVEIIGNHFGQDDQRLIEPLQGLTTSNYYLATYPSQDSYQSDLINNPNKRAQRQLEQYIYNGYYSGKNAMARIIDIHSNNPNSTPLTLAKAKTELADWYLLFNKKHTAMQGYREAYKLLAGSDNSEKNLESLFGHPRSLPSLPDYHHISAKSPVKKDGYILARFDISARGRANNIEILESKPEKAVHSRIKVKRLLRSTRFRPRFAAGEPVATQGIVQRYVFAER